MLETDNFFGLNIGSYLSYDGTAFKMTLNHFFSFKISISILVVHSTKSIKNDQQNWAGRARTSSLTKRIRLVSAKNYIIGQARPKKGEVRSAFLVLEV